MAVRRYSDRDVALILKRAVELEDQRPQPESRLGVTLQDLREIAEGAGIDPSMVDAAAAELDRRGSPSSRAHAVETGVVREIRAVPRHLEAAELRELLWAIDRALPEQGAVSEAAGQLRWTSSGPLRSTQISVEPTDGETVVRVEESLVGAKGPLIGMPSSFGAVIGLLIGAEGGGPATALMGGLLLGIAGFFVGGGIWQLVLDHHVQRVRRLMDRLVDLTRLAAPSLPSVAHEEDEEAS